MNICVYGASSNTIDSSYIEQTEYLGRQMAKRGHSLVYGAGANGLMGAVARGAHEEHGKIIGVAPSFFNVDGILYGKIRVELNEQLTEEEDAEIKEFLIGQCADGFGEGLEQREIEIPEGIMYVSLWNADDYFMLNENEFDEYLIDMKGDQSCQTM